MLSYYYSKTGFGFSIFLGFLLIGLFSYFLYGINYMFNEVKFYSELDNSPIVSNRIETYYKALMSVSGIGAFIGLLILLILLIRNFRSTDYEKYVKNGLIPTDSSIIPQPQQQPPLTQKKENVYDIPESSLTTRRPPLPPRRRQPAAAQPVLQQPVLQPVLQQPVQQQPQQQPPPPPPQQPSPLLPPPQQPSPLLPVLQPVLQQQSLKLLPAAQRLRLKRSSDA